MQLRLTPEHPDVIRAKRTISELEARVAHEGVVAKPGDTASALTAMVPPEVAAQRERLRQSRIEIESLEREIARKEAEETRLRATSAEYQRRIEEIELSKQ